MEPTTEPETPVSPKVKATAAAGLVATALLAVIALVSPGTEVDGEALAAVVAGLMTAGLTLAGYLKRDPLRLDPAGRDVFVISDPEVAAQVRDAIAHPERAVPGRRRRI